ncbi:hypothetical protein BD769DRAFT_1386781 [Suillus cothurnatus]|nr:hypothetical protein BD769DRAFT_1386781 [Suillus cothurnatus]
MNGTPLQYLDDCPYVTVHDSELSGPVTSCTAVVNLSTIKKIVHSVLSMESAWRPMCARDELIDVSHIAVQLGMVAMVTHTILESLDCILNTRASAPKLPLSPTSFLFIPSLYLLPVLIQSPLQESALLQIASALYKTLTCPGVGGHVLIQCCIAACLQHCASGQTYLPIILEAVILGVARVKTFAMTHEFGNFGPEKP